MFICQDDSLFCDSLTSSLRPLLSWVLGVLMNQSVGALYRNSRHYIFSFFASLSLYLKQHLLFGVVEEGCLSMGFLFLRGRRPALSLPRAEE